jgi:hypothetical protein
MAFTHLARFASWAVLSLFVLPCSPSATPSSAKPAASLPVPANPLPSWNDGPARTSILDFVRAVTTEGSADFVPVPQRIATFDNDGTLWSEQPMYFQFLFVVDRVRAMAADHPDWKSRDPFKSAIAGDIEGVMRRSFEPQ